VGTWVAVDTPPATPTSPVSPPIRTTFPTLNGYQTPYAGERSISTPSDQNPPLRKRRCLRFVHGHFLGAPDSIKAIAISVGRRNAGTAYVRHHGIFNEFPTNGTNARRNRPLKGPEQGSANAFFSAIAQKCTKGNDVVASLLNTYRAARDPTRPQARRRTRQDLHIRQDHSWISSGLNNLQPFTATKTPSSPKSTPPPRPRLICLSHSARTARHRPAAPPSRRTAIAAKR